MIEKEKEDKAEKKKEKKTGASKEKEKKPTKEELIILLKEAEQRFLSEKAQTEHLLEIKSKELEGKEKIFKSLSSTNQKLAHEVDQLNKLMEEKKQEEIEKERSKKQNKENKENPMDIVLKVKEKELEDAILLLEKLRKENNEGKKNLSETSDYNKVRELENKLTNEENKYNILSKELKLIERFADERKRAVENAKMMKDLEKKRYESEIKSLKGTLKKIEKEKITEEKVYEVKMTEMCQLKKSLLLYEDRNGIRKIEEELVKQKSLANESSKKFKEKEEKRKKRLEEVEELGRDKETELENSMRHRSTSKKSNRSAKEKDDVEVKAKHNYNSTQEIPIDDKKYNNLNFNNSIANKKGKKSDGGKTSRGASKSKSNIKLFNENEIKELQQSLPQKSIELYDTRFSTILKAKEVEEKKYTTSMKILHKNIKDYEERIEMNYFLIKEAEQKSVIYSSQISQLKEDNTKVTQTVESAIHHLNEVKKAISDKEIENKALIDKKLEMEQRFQSALDLILNPPQVKIKEEEEQPDDMSEEKDDDE